jgi:hypothetical protein
MLPPDIFVDIGIAFSGACCFHYGIKTESTAVGRGSHFSAIEAMPGSLPILAVYMTIMTVNLTSLLDILTWMCYSVAQG